MNNWSESKYISAAIPALSNGVTKVLFIGCCGQCGDWSKATDVTRDQGLHCLLIFNKYMSMLAINMLLSAKS